MALTDIDRARVIVDLVKDGDVASEPAYDAVDKIGGPQGLEVAQAIWDLDPLPGVTNPDNAQLADNYLRVLRKFHRNALISYRTRTAAEGAATTARPIAEADSDTLFGPET